MTVFQRLSKVSRERKLALFHTVLGPNESTSVLDLGAEVSADHDRSVQFLDVYPWKHRVTAVDLGARYVAGTRTRCPEVIAVQADACALP